MDAGIRTGTTAGFVLADAVCPDPRQVLRQIGPDLVVSGTVMYLSDGGGREDHFAILAVDGIHAPVIVPVCRLQRVETGALGEVLPVGLERAPNAQGEPQAAQGWSATDPPV